MGRPKRVTDAEMLAAARTHFVARGFGASTREIAASLGLSEPALFKRFPTKVELFAAAMTPPLADLVALLPVDPSRPGAERIEHVAAGLLAYFREVVPLVLPLMTHPDFRFEAFASRWPESPLVMLRAGLVAYFEAEATAGRLGVAPASAALTLFSSVFGLALFERAGAHGGTFTDTMVREVARTVWAGVGPTG